MCILIVEDEFAYREPLKFRLEDEGHTVCAAQDGISGLERARDFAPDLVLLDIMLPGLSGTDVCREIRAFSDCGIIMLTAKDDEVDKIVGLEMGADDYITKPYSFRELTARIRAVARRRVSGSSADEHGDDEVLRVADIIVNQASHEVLRGGEVLEMPLREYTLLVYLLSNPGRVVTRAQILDAVWGYDFVGDTKTLDVHIKRLRSRIEEDPSQPQIIQTVRGVGYKIAAQ